MYETKFFYAQKLYFMHVITALLAEVITVKYIR